MDDRAQILAALYAAALDIVRAMRTEGKPVTPEGVIDALLERYRDNKVMMREITRIGVEGEVEKYLEEMVTDGRLTRTMGEDGVPVYSRVEQGR